MSFAAIQSLLAWTNRTDAATQLVSGVPCGTVSVLASISTFELFRSGRRLRAGGGVLSCLLLTFASKLRRATWPGFSSHAQGRPLPLRVRRTCMHVHALKGCRRQPAGRNRPWQAVNCHENACMRTHMKPERAWARVNACMACSAVRMPSNRVRKGTNMTSGVRPAWLARYFPLP